MSKDCFCPSCCLQVAYLAVDNYVGRMIKSKYCHGVSLEGAVHGLAVHIEDIFHGKRIILAFHDSNDCAICYCSGDQDKSIFRGSPA
jgi:hypothetical protein